LAVLDPDWASARAKVAGLVRQGCSPERVAAARAELVAAGVVRDIDRALERWPELTEEQKTAVALAIPPEVLELAVPAEVSE
jgi:hypothetical protein